VICVNPSNIYNPNLGIFIRWGFKLSHWRPAPEFHREAGREEEEGYNKGLEAAQSAAKLPQMVVYMQIAKPHPLHFREASKMGVRLPAEIARPGNWLGAVPSRSWSSSGTVRKPCGQGSGAHSATHLPAVRISELESSATGRKPMYMRKPSARWQMTCSAVIFPHLRGVSGRNFWIRWRSSWRQLSSDNVFIT
jgi:hypothetical protein